MLNKKRGSANKKESNEKNNKAKGKIKNSKKLINILFATTTYETPYFKEYFILICFCIFTLLMNSNNINNF
ncbi:hypothetical protein Mgra_00008515 [Meloidogyne graminicola]|uniref:Uncharacterized protein n=1 Tax=Meloidogyne graminicola TaxID=189291 RepID=A0A8S9ZFL3_9BILA|nr:hypothetical protein Mgra_00008515 [Meloidogyne graminicola]